MMTIMQKPKSSPASRFDDHPTVRSLRAAGLPAPSVTALSLQEIHALALAAGADDAGAVRLDHPDLVEEVPWVLRALPGAKTLVAIVMKMHVDDVRSPMRSIANLEFHRTGEATDAVGHRLAVALTERGHRAINPSMAFPMEMDEFPARAWVVSHKRVAVAAQLGRMGLHRSVIHPRFGSFILLGTVITTAEVEGTLPRLDFDPCVSCKLCVAACPVGAIEPDGGFRFSACYDHNYREFMSGFADFAEAIADSRDRFDLRRRVSQSETASMWQSLAYKPNYKAAHCIAVCPAGEDLLGEFLRDRAGHIRDVVRPLDARTEPVYVVKGSDAEAHVAKRFPHKRLRIVQSSLRPAHARAFFRAIPLTFQRGPAKGLRACFHFDLSGEHAVQATVRIDDGTLAVEDGLVGTPDVVVSADGDVWMGIVTKARSPIWAVISRRLRVQGDRSLLSRFAACFPR